MYEADGGKFVYFYGIGFALNIHKILNRISGRTKQMKNRVRLETLDVCMNRAKSEFSESLFGDFEIEEHQKLDFFYFVSENILDKHTTYFFGLKITLLHPSHTTS